MEGLFVKRIGQGSRVALLHGAALAGELCWHQQLRLADRFASEIVDRAGYGRSHQVSSGEDLDADAPRVAGLLPEGAHLVGHSSGAVAAMLAAALQPGAVLSLMLCEPPAFQLALGSEQAQQMARNLEEHLRNPVTTQTGGAIAALGIAAVIWGWGVAQYPVLLPGTSVSLGNAGAPQATLVAIIVVFIAAVILVIPPLSCCSPCRAGACSVGTNTHTADAPTSPGRGLHCRHPVRLPASRNLG